MSETKPLSAIVEYVRSVKTADEQQKAADQLASAIERLYAQVGFHVEEISMLCRTYGQANLLARLPENLRPIVVGVIAGVEQTWVGMSDVPFPAMPDQPEESAGE